MAVRVSRPGDIKPGDLYEDCAFRPCLCVEVEGNHIYGISLIDGSYPCGCNILHCGVRKLTVEEALQWKRSGPPDVEVPRWPPAT